MGFLRFKWKWRLIYVSVLSTAVTCCFVIVSDWDLFNNSSRDKLHGEWNFKKNNMGIFKIKDHFLWVADGKSLDENSLYRDERFGDESKDDGFEESEGDDDAISPMDTKLVQKMLYYPERNYTEHVLILSPIHNVGNILTRFGKMLISLTYPHDLISIGFGEDSSTDNTLFAANMVTLDLAKHFQKVQTIHLNLTGGVHGDWETVHDESIQLYRRKHLAEARNKLLKSALADEDWVLWIDSDVAEIPRDIIQQLLSANKPVVTPSCIMVDREFGHKRIYDKNSWRETRKSLKMLQEANPTELVLEGYGPSHRIWLSHLRQEGRVVPLDGVGGCTLLVKSDCHRKGLIFPEDIYKNHIETEGLAKLAKDMGIAVVGMPFLEVIHS